MKSAAVYAQLLSLCSQAFAGEWQTIRDCRLIENESNDGDSFHVKADGEEHIFRLYFVDTPEADADDSRVQDRIAKQAAEFGISEEESVEIGKKAAAFTRAVLAPTTARRRHFMPSDGFLDGRILLGHMVVKTCFSVTSMWLDQ